MAAFSLETINSVCKQEVDNSDSVLLKGCARRQKPREPFGILMGEPQSFVIYSQKIFIIGELFRRENKAENFIKQRLSFKTYWKEGFWRTDEIIRKS
jgi:hypothetical protein